LAEKTTKRLTVEEKKGQLLSGLVDVRDQILEEASHFSPDRVEAKFVGTWDIQDLLAHLSGWDITNLEAAQEIIQGKVPSFYQSHDRDWKSYNATLIGEFKRDDVQTQLSLLKDTHRKLIAFLQSIPASEFFEDRGIRWRGYKVILSRLLEVEREDEKIHLNQIRDYVDSIQSQA
jgi:hypothetical protein